MSLRLDRKPRPMRPLSPKTKQNKTGPWLACYPLFSSHLFKTSLKYKSPYRVVHNAYLHISVVITLPWITLTFLMLFKYFLLYGQIIFKWRTTTDNMYIKNYSTSSAIRAIQIQVIISLNTVFLLAKAPKYNTFELLLHSKLVCCGNWYTVRGLLLTV